MKISAVSWGKFAPTENKALLPHDKPMPHERVRNGDLLISRANTTELVGAPVLVEADHPNLMLPDKILRVLYRSEAVEARYLLHALRAEPARLHIEAEATGTSHSMRNLSQPKMRDIPIPLAPRAEQERIANKLDALLARVDACRDRLGRVPAILKRFRQAVLNAAVDGDLTEEWRGSGLESWVFERAADVCAKVQSGGTPKEGFTSSGVPFLKVYNIVNQRIDFAFRPQFIAHAVHSGTMAKSVTLPGDVLMNIVGPPLGKVAVVTDEFSAWNINQAITLFRPSPRVSTGWLYCVLCSGKNIQSIVHETRGSAGQVNISLSQCRDFVIPVPPRDEQAEIVRRVESLFALADAIEAKWQAARTQVERLTPALLAKAFRGELVPQDPNDEPASALLARLRGTAEADAVLARKPGRRKTVKETAA
ncbi:restriction endonuclease subunit S [Piscinibacter defluvii]|uniref:restriction endonuclease subunit S n=1 Tax=Piscinibacter defluvii TaxID=1796922 RepID=UPI000FDF24A8|nr:restriction endonuclease subunit S [Piscinibacter defluvii]